jgi:hypothetical protein
VQLSEFIYKNKPTKHVHALYKSKFLHACIQLYIFFHTSLYISLEADIVNFFVFEGLRDVCS